MTIRRKGVVGAAVLLGALALFGWWWWWPDAPPPERPPEAVERPAAPARSLVPPGGEPRHDVTPDRAETTGVEALSDASAAAGVAADAAVSASGGAEEAGAVLPAHFAENARLAEELIETYCEESSRIDPETFPDPDSARDRDAWAFMAIRMDWEGGQRPPGLLRLGAPLRQRLRDYGADWPTRVQPYDLEGLDFGWMGELHQFDHWDVLRDVRANDPRQSSALSVGLPNFFELQNWTKLRFARALGAGDVLAASRDVRQLAFLLRTTGLVLADLVAYRLLVLEREAHAAALQSGRPIPGWTPIEEEALERYRRLARSSLQFHQPGVSDATVRRATECSRVSRCSALLEGVGVHRAYANVTGRDGALPVRLAQEAGCDPRNLEWLSQTHPLSAAELASGASEDPNPLLLLLRPDGGP